MKILWSVNTLIPDVAKKMGLRSGHAISWVDAMRSAYQIMGDKVSLTIVCHGGYRVKEITKFVDETVTYYILPHKCEIIDMWRDILNEVQPDVIHIYGTERKHNLILIEKYKDIYPIIISLQGIISEYYRHYYAGLDLKTIVFNYTIHDILFRNGILEGKRAFRKQAELENKMFRSVDYVEGRSDWDRATVKMINPNLTYFYCPRLIREPFYSKKWNIDECEPHSILVSQGDYPIKGLHFLIDAIAVLKQKYPDIKLYVAGKDIYKGKWYKEKGYTKIIKKKIRAYNLEKSIEFTGFLDASSMAEKLSKVHVCVIPSAIENAPNSLAEAMIVGTPIVASYVGGNADMLYNGKCGLLYCYYEPQMLAERVDKIFEDSTESKLLSQKSREIARRRHDQDVIPQKLLSIYQEAITLFNK